MSLIEKIDVRIAEFQEKEDKYLNDKAFTLAYLCKGRRIEAEVIKREILSEQKEPCAWCKEDCRMEFNWIDEDGNTIVTKDNMVIGGVAEYCPVCGRALNQSPTGTRSH